jgi:hypothetical protein
MADEITLAMLQDKQAEITATAERLVSESDPQRIQDLSAEIEKQANELQAMALALEAQEKAKRPPSQRGKAKVALTPDQKARILEKTGVEMEVLVLDDDDGIWARILPTSLPHVIEERALDWARSEQARRILEAESRAYLARLIAAIEAAGSDQLIEQLNRLRADPNFLAGMMQEKKEP